MQQPRQTAGTTSFRPARAAGRGLLVLALMAALAACRAPTDPASSPDTPPPAGTAAASPTDPATTAATAPAQPLFQTGLEGPPPRRMAVAQGAVVIAGPRGYCIDRVASRDRRGGRAALTVLSDCRGLGAGPFSPRPAHPAVLTAAVAAPGRGLPVEAAAADLAAYFRSATGRAALSRVGKADTVSVLEALAADGAFYLHLTDAAPFAWGAVQPDYWRGLLMAGGRTVTVSVLSPPGSTLTRDQGLDLLRDFVAALRAATAEAGLKPPG